MLRRGLRLLKSLASIFQIRRLQSVLIFSILNHPCSITVYYYITLWRFSIPVNYYFQVSFNSKVTLYVTKIAQNTETELL